MKEGRMRRAGRIRLLAAPGWQVPDFVDLLALGPKELASRPGASVLSTVPSTMVAVLPFREQRLYFKYFLKSGPVSRLKGIFRGSKALRALKGAWMLSKSGLATPCIVAVSEPASLYGSWESLLVTRHMEGQTLRVLLRTVNLDSKVRAGLACSLGQFIARLHGEGLVHGDLHPGNIMAMDPDQEQLAKSDACYPFALMDTERVERASGTLTSGMLRDLALLNHPNLGYVSRADRLRFLASYMESRQEEQGCPELCRDMKGLARKIHELSRKRYGHR
jgi:tRNA A-37 threonylcarbamoyl transferase component Bud32